VLQPARGEIDGAFLERLGEIRSGATRAPRGIVAERNRLRGEVNLLKANANVVIDRRTLPGHAYVTPEGQVMQVLSPLPQLTASELADLRKAISREFLSQEGLVRRPAWRNH
jgi:hypothetical protein